VSNSQRFSAYKSYQQIAQVSELPQDENFDAVAAEIINKHNAEWLNVEVQLAGMQATSARQWQEFQDTADEFPNLKYETAGDGAVRASHKKLDGVIRPKSDPFWQTYFPPNDYGCRCDVQEVGGKAKLTNVPGAIDIPPLFQQNAGITGEVFPLSHPYFKAGNDIKQVEMQLTNLQPSYYRGPVQTTYLKNALQNLGISAAKLKNAYSKIEDYEPKIIHYLVNNAKGITNDEAHALFVQTIPTLQTAINSSIEAGITAENQAYVDLMDSALNKLDDEVGDYVHTITLKKADLEAFLKEHKVGNEVTQKGYLYASNDNLADASANIKIVINAKKAKDISNISANTVYNDTEKGIKEVLFNKNLSYKVTEVNTSNNITTINVEEI